MVLLKMGDPVGRVFVVGFPTLQGLHETFLVRRSSNMMIRTHRRTPNPEINPYTPNPKLT